MPEYTDTCLLFLVVTLADAMRSMDVLTLYVFASRDLRMFPSHVPPDRLLTLPLSCLRFLAYASYSSSVMATRPSRTSLRPLVFRTIRLFPCRFFLRPVFYPSYITYPTGRYFCLIHLQFLRLFVLVSPRLVYILGWRWDDPHLQSTLQPP